MGCDLSTEHKSEQPTRPSVLPGGTYSPHSDLLETLQLHVAVYTEFLLILCDLLTEDELKTAVMETASSLKKSLEARQFVYSREISQTFKYLTDRLLQTTADKLSNASSAKACVNCSDLNDQVCDLRQELLQKTARTLNFQHLYQQAQCHSMQQVEESDDNYRLLNAEFGKSLQTQTQLTTQHDALLAAYDHNTRELKQEISVLKVHLETLKEQDDKLRQNLLALSSSNWDASRLCTELLETQTRLMQSELKFEEIKQSEACAKAQTRIYSIQRLKRSVALAQRLAVARWSSAVPIVDWTQEVSAEIKSEFLNYAPPRAKFSPKALEFFERHLDSKYAADSCISPLHIKPFEASSLQLLETSPVAQSMLSNLLALKARDSVLADLLTRLLGMSRHRSMPLSLAVIINRLRVTFNSVSGHKSSVLLISALKLVFDEFREHVDVRDCIATRLCPKDMPMHVFLSCLMKFTLSELDCTLTFTMSLQETALHSAFSDEDTLQTVELLQRATEYQVSEFLLRLYVFEACNHPDLGLCEASGVVEKAQFLKSVEETYYVGAGIVSSCSSIEECHLN
jgi:hypothetical protein